MMLRMTSDYSELALSLLQVYFEEILACHPVLSCDTPSLKKLRSPHYCVRPLTQHFAPNESMPFQSSYGCMLLTIVHISSHSNMGPAGRHCC